MFSSIILLFSFCSLVNLKPVIIENNLGYCEFKIISNNTKNYSTQLIHMFSNDWIIKEKNFNIHYKLCGTGTGNRQCGNQSLACLSNDKASTNLGTEFILVNNTRFRSINGEFCSSKQNYSLIIDLVCPKNHNEQGIVMLNHVTPDNCEYYVAMRNPNCIPNYSVVIYGYYISIYINKTFFVVAKDRNFSISLGGALSNCDEPDVIACEIINKKKTSLSLASHLKLNYNGQFNELIFSGHTIYNMSNKFDKRFKLRLKCNWENHDNEYNLTYIPKQIQGNKYDFQLETSFGCIKHQPNCKVHDNYYDYDLSKLYNVRSSYSVKDPNGNEYLMDVCGSPTKQMKKICKSNHAQICEINDKNIINRGSIFKPLKIENDMVILDIEYGSVCTKKPEYLYSTTIRFFCGDKERGPRFVRKDDCRTFFDWETPEACPKINITRCQYVKPNYHKCSFNYQNAYFDLTPLSTKDTKIVVGNQEILIRPCGSLNDSSMYCMKDSSIALKKMNETNIKYRIKSLGKFYESSIIKQNLIIKYITGATCDFGDYTSEIRFKCSNVEKNPVVTKVDNCHYSILWETFYGCPKEKKCSLIDKNLNRSVDFSNVAERIIEFSIYNRLYRLDICSSNYTICTLNNAAAVDCRYIPFSRMNFTIYSYSASLTWDLQYDLFDMIANVSIKRIVINFKCAAESNNQTRQTLHGSVLLVTFNTINACSSECSSYIKELENTYCHIPKEEPITSATSNLALVIGLAVCICCLLTAISIYYWKRRNCRLFIYQYVRDLQR